MPRVLPVLADSGMRNRNWPVAALTASVVLFHLLTIRPDHDWGGDFAQYILHARNIAEGRPYGDIGYIHNPRVFWSAPPTYPPVFPLMLSPIYAAFGADLVAMKVVGVVCFGLALWMMHLALAGHLSFELRLAVLFVTGFSPLLWEYKDHVLTEFPFLFLTYLNLWLIRRATTGPLMTVAGSLRWGALTGFTMYLAYATRSVGLVLLGALLLQQLFRADRDRRYVATAAGAMVLCVAVENLTLHRAGNYLGQMAAYGGGADAVREMLVLKARMWFDAFGSFFGFGLRGAAAAVALAMSIVGFARSAGRWTIVEAFTVCYLALILVWPLTQDPRFLIPILPLVVAYAAVCWQWGASKVVDRRVGLAAGGVVLALLCGGFVLHYARQDYGPMPQGVHSPPAHRFFRFIRERTDPSDVVIFYKPRILALMTGRRSGFYHVVEDDALLWRYFHEIGATHLVVTPKWWIDRVWLAEFVQRNRDRFERVYEADGTDGGDIHRVYRFR